MTSHNIDLLKKFFNDKFKNNDFFTNVIFYSHGSDEFNIQFFYNKSLNLNSIKAYIKKLSFILFQDHKFDLVVHKQLGFVNVHLKYEAMDFFNEYDIDKKFIKSFDNIDLNEYYLKSKKKLKKEELEVNTLLYFRETLLNAHERYVNHKIIKKNKHCLLLQINIFNVENNTNYLKVFFIDKQCYLNDISLRLKNLENSFNLKYSLNEEKQFCVHCFMLPSIKDKLSISSIVSISDFDEDILFTDLDNKFIIKKIFIDFKGFKFE